MEALSRLSQDPQVVEQVTEAARRILLLKFRTTTFDEPVPDLAKINSTLRTKDHLATSLEMTRESIVLLKNEGVLPLSDSLRERIAVIGPMGDAINPGHYAGSDYTFGTTILDGVRKIADDVTFTRGYYRTNYTDFESMRDEAVVAAKNANVAILALGSASVTLDPTNPYDRTDGEGYDHADLDFPGPQVELLQVIVETGTPVVVILSGGQVFTMEYAAANASAILHTFLQGEYTGDVVGEILVGETNPSGKLSVSIPKTSYTLPAYYNHLPMERKSPVQGDADWQYPRINRTARYPFGFGLSYTSFSVSDVSASEETGLDGSISVSAGVTNTGDAKGKEVLQLYFRQYHPAIERPVKSLIRFTKIELDMGESKTVQFSIPVAELGYYVNGRKRVDMDTYGFFIESSSAEEHQIAFNVTVT